MSRNNKIWMLLLFVTMITVGCQKNYYSGKAKNSDCGCPNKKGMVGY